MTRSEIEQAMLGGILAKPESLGAVARLVLTDDMEKNHGRVLFSMLSLARTKTPINHLTVAKDLERVGLLCEVGGPTFLLQLNTDEDAVVMARRLAIRLVSES